MITVFTCYSELILMKIPSLTKIPTHQKFKYEPRFYDPVKEDLAQRTQRIKSEMGLNSGSGYRSNIRQAFHRRSKENQRSNITQLVIIILLVGTFLGFIYYGEIVLYISMALLAVYIFISKTDFFKKRN